MIINHWGREFTGKFGHVLPEAYLCFDTEYTGSDPQMDVILEVGHTMVEGTTVVDQASHVLNWYAYPGISKPWLDYKLAHMRATLGERWRFNREFMETHGKNPLDILRFYHKLFETWNSRDFCFVAQNGQQADEKLLQGNFSRYINKPFELPGNRYFDTGVIFKATQIYRTMEHLRQAVLPTKDDTLTSYFLRVAKLRMKGVHWSLPTILEHYDLIKRQNLDLKQYHSAGFDSGCLHWIMEEYRREAVIPVLSPAHLEQIFQEEMTKPVEKNPTPSPIMSRPTHRQRLR